MNIKSKNAFPNENTVFVFPILFRVETRILMKVNYRSSDRYLTFSKTVMIKSSVLIIEAMIIKSNNKHDQRTFLLITQVI